MPKDSKPVKLPAQFGRIIVEGKESVNFWIRAFRLEADVARVHHDLLAQELNTTAHMSISSEYRISPDLIYIYLLCPVLDMLGVYGGSGVVYYASPESEKKAVEQRDKFTEFTVRTARYMGKLVEIRATEPNKEL